MVLALPVLSAKTVGGAEARAQGAPDQHLADQQFGLLRKGRFETAVARATRPEECARKAPMGRAAKELGQLEKLGGPARDAAARAGGAGRRDLEGAGPGVDAPSPMAEGAGERGSAALEALGQLGT